MYSRAGRDLYGVPRVDNREKKNSKYVPLDVGRGLLLEWKDFVNSNHEEKGSQ